MQMRDHYDMAIIGGGLAGLTSALLLAHQGFVVACLDREPAITQLEKSYDTRTTAISWGSRNVLRAAKIWDDIKDRACPIRDIKIMDGEMPFTLSFLSEEVEGKEFGWIVDNQDLRRLLHEHAAAHESIDHFTSTNVTGFDLKDPSKAKVIAQGKADNVDSGFEISADLILGCDGRNSQTREFMGIGTWGHDYGQKALVFIARHEQPHNHVAIEHFLPKGPFASLPMYDDGDGHRSAVVWSLDEKEAHYYQNCSAERFNAKLNRLYNGRFGEAYLAGNIAAWPLNIKMAYKYIAPRMALMAEAAHGIHPIAGQGLNISLRDSAAMTEILMQARDEGIKDLGSDIILKRYQRARRIDNVAMSLAMEGFNSVFSNKKTLPSAMRRAGLRIIGKSPRFKRFFMTQAMGMAGHVPNMVKEEHHG